MNIYLIILILIIIFLKDFYTINDHEDLTNIKHFNIKVNTNYFKKYNIAIYNSISNLYKLNILSRYLPLNIHLYDTDKDLDTDKYDLIILRETKFVSYPNYFFVSGFNYEYFFLLTKFNINSISSINKNNNYIFGTTLNNRKILETILKISEFNNYKIIIGTESEIFYNFKQDKINFLFHICDEKNINLKKLSLDTQFKIMNLDIDYEILTRILRVYKKKIPINIFNKELTYDTINTFAVRNIIVTKNKKNNEKLINLILEIFFYYNKKIRDEYQNFMIDLKFHTEFLDKNHLSYNFDLKYHPISLQFFKKRNYIIHKSI